MPRQIKGHGIELRVPDAWDGRVWKAEERADDVPGSATPTLHAANFALPATDADFGYESLLMMGPGDIFLALKEYGRVSVTRPSFQNELRPPFDASRFEPDNFVASFPGLGAFQFFFTKSHRAFCLYLVASMPVLRSSLQEANEALRTLVVQEVAQPEPVPSPSP